MPKKVVCGPPKFPKWQPGAKYVSAGRQSYWLREVPGGFWDIVRHKNGCMCRELQGVHTTHDEAEKALIGYLRRTDRHKRAIYPGCPGQLLTKSTEPL